jgi:serine/threonine protein kinase
MFELFGRYRLLRRLATGGMAEIFLAEEEGAGESGKRLVIKRLLPILAENDQFVRMFLDEARIAARLNHPNIVQIFDLGSVGDAYFIAMEYLHGADARRMWKQADTVGKPLPPELACLIAIGAAAGLHYAHNKVGDQGLPLGIVHRDVSPQNIFVTFDGVVKVVDFGIAKAADQSEITRSGVVKGKYSYMSPEQAAGEKVDHRTDQFALGVVLHELLTGERLFKRKTDIETAQAVEDCDVPLPSAISSRVPASLDPLVLRALSRNAEDRFRDCQAFQIALEDWVAHYQPVAPGPDLAGFMGEIYQRRLDDERREPKAWWEASTLDADSASGPSGPTSAPSGPPDSGSQQRPVAEAMSLASSDRNSEATTRPELRSGRTRLAPEKQRRRVLIGGVGTVLGLIVGLLEWRVLRSASPPPEEPRHDAADGGVALALDGGPPAGGVTGLLRIMTLPLGAEVAVNGKALGKSPIDPIELPVGLPAEIEANLPGYQVARTRWEVGAGEGVVQLSLSPLPQTTVGHSTPGRSTP